MDIVIGAGVSGISYGNFTSNDFIVLEADDKIGGYCKTVKQSGFVWDYSGHFFHFRNSEIEQIVNRNIDKSTIRKVKKQTQILYKDRYIDFPFQKNIHQLEQSEFIDCLYDLFAADNNACSKSFKEMVFNNLGCSIAQKFLVPYNEKLYACDLDTLDKEAMGRFFPKASREEIILNFRNSNNDSYNAFFTYPTGGAIEYINSLAANIDSDKIKLSQRVVAVNLAKKTVVTDDGLTYQYDNLISTMPFPQLLKMCGVDYDEGLFSWNKVLVFNLGFDKKGNDIKNSWIYVPDSEICFYRLGYYDNIIGGDRMSLYVELGFSRDAVLEAPEYYLERVLSDLKKCGIVTDQQLMDYHSVAMDPAYVHINRRSNEALAQYKAQLALSNVYSIGRYGSWTYCSIEDNILEARELANVIKK